MHVSEVTTMNWVTRSSAIASVVLGLILSVPATLAAGIQALNVPSDGSSSALSGAVWYPCALAPTAMKLGPFLVSATKDCPITGTKLPLIVISHGRKGNFLGHRDTAQALADAGFAVAAISHPGDNVQDSSRSDDLSAFVERPADIRRLVDYLLGSWSYATAIDPDRIGLFGFSRGGYTGLVVIGANPRFSRDIGMCVGQTGTLCGGVRQGTLEPPVHDRRVKALVIADPLSIFFTKASFDEVRVPIQLWRSERGGDGVTPESVAAVANELPVKADVRNVPNSQHFSFLPPCPDDLARSAHELCTDPWGFDRKAFHEEFNAQVVAFFRHTLR
jgi:predicted dienelactone hydrolase